MRKAIETSWMAGRYALLGAALLLAVAGMPSGIARAQDPGESLLEALDREVQSLAARTRGAVVLVVADTGDPTCAMVSMSGVIIDPRGEVVTYGRCVGAVRSVSVRLATGERMPAEVVGVDDETGVALLTIAGHGPFTAVTPGDDATLREGALVLAIGNPFGLQSSVSLGNVSGLHRVVEIGGAPVPHIIQITNPVNPGDPGGLLVNVRGEMVGLLASSCRRRAALDAADEVRALVTEAAQRVGQAVAGHPTDGTAEELQRILSEISRAGAGEGATARRPGAADELDIAGGDGISWALPVSAVAEALQRIRGGAAHPRGYLGVRILGIDPAMRAQLALGDEIGVLVVDVVPGSPAALGGLRQYDIVRRYGGQVVSDALAFRRMVFDTPPGTSVAVEVMREGAILTLTLGVEPREEVPVERSGNAPPSGGDKP